MTTPARPTRPATRWDDRTCGVPGCPCPHNPQVGKYPDPPCNRGYVAAASGQRTPGVRGAGGVQITEGVRSDDAGDEVVARCRTCREHARRAREAHT